MRHLDLSLDNPAENLALDEALLEAADAGEISGGVLRLWESSQYLVVLGRSSAAGIEVNLAACRGQNVAVLRRCSGGGTILAGPGCLMYAVVLPYETYPQLRAIDACHEFVLGRMTRILSSLAPGITLAGISDLVIPQQPTAQARKISGNAMRSKRHHVLYHGTLLYGFDLERLGHLLAAPTREPAYRAARSHTQFLTNLPLPRSTLVEALVDGWQATNTLEAWPQARMTAIVRSKYDVDANWTIYRPDDL